jgi:hypothetical protein
MLRLLTERAQGVMASIDAPPKDDTPRPDLPQDCVTWADSVAGGGALPVLLPPPLMAWAEGRKMQRQLAALGEAARQRSAALLLAHLARVDPTVERSEAAQRVEACLAAGLRSCALSPSRYAAHQQLLWLLNSEDSAPLAEHLPNVLHEMTFAWHAVRPHLPPLLSPPLPLNA